MYSLYPPWKILGVHWHIKGLEKKPCSKETHFAVINKMVPKLIWAWNLFLKLHHLNPAVLGYQSSSQFPNSRNNLLFIIFIIPEPNTRLDPEYKSAKVEWITYADHGLAQSVELLEAEVLTQTFYEKCCGLIWKVVSSLALKMLKQELNNYFPLCRGLPPPYTQSWWVRLHLADVHGGEHWPQEKWSYVYHHPLPLPFIPKPWLTPLLVWLVEDGEQGLRVLGACTRLALALHTQSPLCQALISPSPCLLSHINREDRTFDWAQVVRV